MLEKPIFSMHEVGNDDAPLRHVPLVVSLSKRLGIVIVLLQEKNSMQIKHSGLLREGNYKNITSHCK